MAMIKYMPRPQKKRGNKSDNQHIIKDSKQTKTSFTRGKVIGQKLLKPTIYNRKWNETEITINLYTYKLNTIPGIIDEVIRCVVTDAPQIKRICFETGYGKPKKAIDIRKSASFFLTNTLGYTANKGGTPKTFKFLNDHANRIVIFPQNYIDYAREETERKEKEQAIIDAKNAKKERKANKKRKKYFVHNKWKKNLKYPPPKKRPQPVYNDQGELLDEHLITPGGDDNDPISESDDEEGNDSEKEQVEETEATYLRNFMNLQVIMQESEKQKVSKPYQRSWNKGNKKEVDIFEGVMSNKQQFEYVDPDAWRYDNSKSDKKKKHLSDSNLNEMIGNKVGSNGEWECEFCSFQNGSVFDKCQMCFNERFQKRYAEFMNVVNENNRQNKRVNVVGNNNNKNKKGKRLNKNEWDCKICTYINENNEGEVCDMCGMTDTQREKYLDRQFDNYGNGFFDDAKPKQKNLKNNKLKCEQKINENMNVKVSYGNIGKKSKKNSMKMNGQKNVQVVVKKNKGKVNVMNEEIAKINREYNAAVWKAQRDKEKRIEMLKRNGGNGKKKKKKWNSISVDIGIQNQNKNEKNKRNNKNNKLNKKGKNGGGKLNTNKVKINRNQVKINGKSRFINDGKQKPNLYAKINFQWVDKLVKMGYKYDEAFDAVSNTNSIGFNEALDYLMHNT